MKNRNLNPLPPLTPEGCGTPQPPPTQRELALLAENQAQRHALRELNKTIRFVLKTLGKPMRVRNTDKPARKMRKP